MPIRIHCPVCGYHIKAPDGTEGRRGQCPRCKLMIRLPTAAELASRAQDQAVSPSPASMESDQEVSFNGLQDDSGGPA